MSAGEFVVRSVVLAVALLVLMRIVGKRLVGEVAAVDLVVGVTVGTIAGSTSISQKVPLWGGLLALLVWGCFECLSATLASRRRSFESLVSGTPTTLVQQGNVSRTALRRVMLSESALNSMLRRLMIDSTSEVEKATLEPSGKLGVVKKSSQEST